MAQNLATVVLLISTTRPGMSTVYSYDFTANTADVVPFNGSDYTSYSFDLTDTATNSNSVPAVTFADGDTFSGTITLSSPFTLSATNAANREGALVYLQIIDTNGQLVSMDESLTFRYNGLDVTPAGYANYGGSEGEIAIGKYITDDIPAFTFNEVDFSATMIGASDNDGEHDDVVRTRRAWRSNALAKAPILDSCSAES